MKRSLHRGTAAALMIATILGLSLAGCAGGGAGDETVAVTGVALNVTEKTLSIGGTLQLAATINPANASDKDVDWTSGNAAVATVDSRGLVTAKAGGTATITVHTTDGNRTASCAVTVLNKFSVSFNTAGGSTVVEQSLDSGSTVTKPADPTREGYTFAGWFADSGLTDPWDFAADLVAGATTIYAKWTGIDYTLTYNANGGSGTMASVTKPCGTDVIAPSCGFEAPLGHIFAGWALTPTSTSPWIPGAVFTMTPGGFTLYAIWECAFTFTESSGNLTITGLSPKWPASETSLVIPSTLGGKTVTAIKSEAFYGKQNLTALVIPDTVKTIGYSAFQDCSGLVSVNLGAGVTLIDTGVFHGCSSLVSISIPASVTSMAPGSSFSNCTKLESITVAAANPNYCSDNGVVYNKDKTYLMRCPQKKSGAFTIPNTVTSIYQYAFSGCTGITSIAWSTNLNSIGESAFEGCTGLTSLSFPASLQYINYGAFVNCSNLASMTLNEGLIQVRQGAFQSTALTTLAVPASVTHFQNQFTAGLASITVNASNATYSSVDGVVYSKDQKTIHVWPAAKSGTSYTVLSTVTKVGTYAFYGSKLQSITLPSGLTTIEANAIMQCPTLTTITIPSAVTSIGMNFGSSCPTLTTIRVDAVTPPTLGSSLPNNSGLLVKVPAASVASYKAASIWSASASKIVSQ